MAGKYDPLNEYNVFTLRGQNNFPMVDASITPQRNDALNAVNDSEYKRFMAIERAPAPEPYYPARLWSQPSDEQMALINKKLYEGPSLKRKLYSRHERNDPNSWIKTDLKESPWARMKVGK